MAIATRRRDDQAIGRGTLSVHLPREEWAVLQSWHPNLLIAGPESATAAALRALSTILRPSIAHWHAARPLPAGTFDAPQTLVVHDVSNLSGGEQRRLLDWIRTNEGATQVVSLTTAPLLPHVENGSFDSALFYALNVVFCDLFE
jgi:hypothetical protein